MSKRPLCDECHHRMRVAYWRPTRYERRTRGEKVVDKQEPLGFFCGECKVFTWKEESVEVTA